MPTEQVGGLTHTEEKMLAGFNVATTSGESTDSCDIPGLEILFPGMEIEGSINMSRTKSTSTSTSTHSLYSETDSPGHHNVINLAPLGSRPQESNMKQSNPNNFSSLDSSDSKSSFNIARSFSTDSKSSKSSWRHSTAEQPMFNTLTHVSEYSQPFFEEPIEEGYATANTVFADRNLQETEAFKAAVFPYVSSLRFVAVVLALFMVPVYRLCFVSLDGKEWGHDVSVSL